MSRRSPYPRLVRQTPTNHSGFVRKHGVSSYHDYRFRSDNEVCVCVCVLESRFVSRELLSDRTTNREARRPSFLGAFRFWSETKRTAIPFERERGQLFSRVENLHGIVDRKRITCRLATSSRYRRFVWNTIIITLAWRTRSWSNAFNKYKNIRRFLIRSICACKLGCITGRSLVTNQIVPGHGVAWIRIVTLTRASLFFACITVFWPGWS